MQVLKNTAIVMLGFIRRNTKNPTSTWRRDLRSSSPRKHLGKTPQTLSKRMRGALANFNCAETLSQACSNPRKRNAEVDASIRTEIAQLLGQEGCPICTICDEYLQRSWLWFFRESYASGSQVGKYIDYWGFCKHHTKLVAKIGPTWQKSVIYSAIIDAKLPILKDVVNVLKSSSPAFSPLEKLFIRRLRRMSGRIRPKGECLFCKSVDETARFYVERLVNALSYPEIERLFKRSSGLCMHHFFQILSNLDANNAPQLALVAELQMEKLSNLQQEFDEFFRKADYRYSSEPKGQEQTTWTRTVQRFIGNADL